MADDSTIPAAPDPSQGGSPPASGIVQQLGQLLPRLLPALVMGTGAALTSPVRSAPLIAGRALLGGMEGWEASKPDQRALYYKERAAREQQTWQALQQQAADRGAYADTIEDPERREAFRVDPKAYMTQVMQEKQAPENRAYLSKVWGVEPDALKGLTPKELHGAFLKQMLQGQQISRVVAEVQPDGTRRYVARYRYGPQRGQVAWLGGVAPSPKTAAPKPPKKTDEEKFKDMTDALDKKTPASPAAAQPPAAPPPKPTPLPAGFEYANP